MKKATNKQIEAAYDVAKNLGLINFGDFLCFCKSEELTPEELQDSDYMQEKIETWNDIHY